MAFNYTPRPGIASATPVATGGMETRRLLTSTLEEAKRRARLTGRTVSSAETEGISRGYFGGASERLTQRKGLALTERGQDITQRGQDITEGLGRENIALGRENIGLGYAGLESKEKMFEKGLISAEELQKARLASQEAMHAEDIKLGYSTVSTQARTAKEQGELGFFGSGGWLGLGLGECIIIAACTNPNSEEVNITRRYRDKIMLPETLRGYYMIAEQVVPLIHKSDKLKQFLKKHLVDSLVATCEWKLGETDKVPAWKARIITGLFLGTCNVLGNTKPQFVRSNGEVF